MNRFGLGLEQRQSLRLEQKLVITPQLQQAIKLLQLNRTELTEMLQQEILENPVLEEVVGEVEPSSENKMDGAEASPEPVPEKESTELDEPLKDFDWENYFEEEEATGILTAHTVVGHEEPKPAIPWLSAPSILEAKENKLFSFASGINSSSTHHSKSIVIILENKYMIM